VAEESLIYLITGVPGSGKSSVAVALMRHFPFGLHIPMDDLREWVVSGIAPPLPTWTEETTRQFRLAREAAAQVARTYADSGFAIAIDDVIFPEEAEALFVSRLVGHRVQKVLLRPRFEVALERNAARTNKGFDTSVLVEVTRRLHEDFERQDFEGAGWVVVNSSDLSVEETVEEILRRT
jgi:chloramphenicol 3-O-phosphotransferase